MPDSPITARLGLATADDAPAVIQDGRPVAAGAIRALAAAGRHWPRGRRLALATRRADLVLAALLAAQDAGTELLLLREPLPADALAGLGVAGTLDDALHAAPTGHDAPAGGPAILLASSGTTGTPKVARHALANLLARCAGPGGPGDRWLLTFQPASFAGLQVILTAAVAGAPLVAVEGGTAASLAEAALAHRPSHASGTPTFWRAFVIALGARAADAPFRQITIGGEAVDQATLDELARRFPAAGLRHIYASTEAGSLFAVKDGREGFPAAWLDQAPSGIGLRIRDGVLEVRSPRGMLGYLGDAPSPLTGDGWIRTGDLVERAGDRVLFRGRADSVINVGGAKVVPEKVEALLCQVPGVRDARVYGARNPITGALVAAEVVAEPGVAAPDLTDRIRAALAPRLQPHEVPRVVRVVDAIALTAAGKKARQTS